MPLAAAKLTHSNAYNNRPNYFKYPERRSFFHLPHSSTFRLPKIPIYYFQAVIKQPKPSELPLKVSLKTLPTQSLSQALLKNFPDDKTLPKRLKEQNARVQPGEKRRAGRVKNCGEKRIHENRQIWFSTFGAL